MRYPPSEKLEIIQLVEQSHLPVQCTLGKLGISRPTFYRWYDRYQSGGPAALEDRRPQPGRVWNRIPDEVRDRVVRPLMSPPCRPGNSPCASPTWKGILCQRLRCIGCSKPMI